MKFPGWQIGISTKPAAKGVSALEANIVPIGRLAQISRLSSIGWFDRILQRSFFMKRTGIGQKTLRVHTAKMESSKHIANYQSRLVMIRARSLKT